MPARVQPQSLLILSRQRLVALLIKRSNVKGAAGDLLPCEKSWVSWLEVATTLLTPSMTNTILVEVMAGLDNNHSCSLLAPLLSPRLTVLKLPELPPDLPEAELVKLFQRLPSCSSLQNIQFGTQVATNTMPSFLLCLFLIFIIFVPVKASSSCQCITTLFSSHHLLQVSSLLSQPLSMLLLTSPPSSLRSLSLSNCNTLLPSPQVTLG